MEKNNSPYVYEKPLRSERANRGKRLASLSALGVVGMFGIVGGSAIASSIVANPATDARTTADSIEVLSGASLPAEIGVDPVTTAASIETSSVAPAPVEPSPIITMPLQETKPKPNSAQIELPAIQRYEFGNTSSATPTAGSNSGSYSSQPFDKSDFSERDHDDEHDDDRHQGREGDSDNDHKDSDD